MFDRFPDNFQFHFNGMFIEFKNSSRGLTFYNNELKRGMDLLDIIYIPLFFESVDKHDVIYSKDDIKRIAVSYAKKHFLKEVL